MPRDINPFVAKHFICHPSPELLADVLRTHIEHRCPAPYGVAWAHPAVHRVTMHQSTELPRQRREAPVGLPKATAWRETPAVVAPSDEVDEIRAQRQPVEKKQSTVTGQLSAVDSQ